MNTGSIRSFILMPIIYETNIPDQWVAIQGPDLLPSHGSAIPLVAFGVAGSQWMTVEGERMRTIREESLESIGQKAATWPQAHLTAAIPNCKGV